MPAHMGRHPRIIIDLDLLESNTRALTVSLAAKGISLRGVTKGCLGDTHVAKSFLAGGVRNLADSRLLSFRKMRAAFPELELTMLRPAMSWEVPELVELVDVFLVGSLEYLEELAGAAAERGLSKRVILMIETGGEREGIPLDKGELAIKRASGLPGIELVGLGTHTSCLGKRPSPDSSYQLVRLAEECKDLFDKEEVIISAGNSAMLENALRGNLPPDVNELRIGEGILLGRETVRGERLEGCHQGTFILEAEIVEEKELRSTGKRWERRLLVAMGRLDIGAGNVFPLSKGLEILEFYSDLCALRSTGQLGEGYRGQFISFAPDYLALLGAMHSPYVSKIYRRGGREFENEGSQVLYSSNDE